MRARCARDVMCTDVVSVTEDLAVAELARVLTERRISGAPVLDEHGRLVGVVSMTDIVSHELRVGHPVVGEAEFYQRTDRATRGEMGRLGMHEEDYGDLVVRDIMTPVVISAGPDTAIRDLAKRMIRYRVHRLLISDAERLLGVVSALDLVAVLADDEG